ncbi:AMP-dependent synthetase/ligase [Parasphingorhabdus halotolerans]|uniref:Long-chain fatty acid--CoA ligase n=1 Tax=Parasphingorhabdus halotolerans TaxID=2725558 RepID=A0A6H2DLN1_9SPHN|nr:long-chain fatty acid--CoA ligase [Parasphingorhabdus halotolerans]QJB68893.1 long-chain fatty acid--CoA ligase [Parasphingorhabdus halotolerans]
MAKKLGNDRYLEIDQYSNLVSMFFDRATQEGNKPFLSAKIDGQWRAISWIEAARKVAALAKSFKNLGLKPGDRVMLVSENRPEWCITDLAIMAAKCITVPTYTTNTTTDHRHILDNSGARAVIVSDQKLAQNLVPAVISSADADIIIGISDLRIGQSGDFDIHSWHDLTQGTDEDVAEITEAAKAITRDDVACIIYTSGTGGKPRGVMQPHGSILHNVKGPAEVIENDFGWDDEVFLSFLPLSHAYEHSAGQFFPIGLGAQIFYSEGLEKLASNIEEVRPTIMVVVPRLFEVLRARLIKTVEKQGKMPNYLLGKALALGEREAEGKSRKRDKLMDVFLNKTLRPKVQQRFGGRIKAMVSGGAPLNPEIGVFFQSLGLTMLQGYGQTESGPIIACNRPRTGLKMDTVGPPMIDTEVKIAEDGEILVRGALVMKGYWRNQAETDKVIIDGWLHTGDIGLIDEAGRVAITDRKKDIIVNDKGDNVAPQKVEGMLTLQPEILQAMIVGDKRPYMVAAIVPDPEWALEWSRKEGLTYDFVKLQANPVFKKAVGDAVDRVNKDLSVIEKVRRFEFADEPFSIENEELTPSMKIRRHVIKARYQERLDALYKK